MSSSFSTSRLAARDDLFTSLGMLAGPIRRIAEDPAADPLVVPFIRAQFRKDYEEFVKKVWAYGTVPGAQFHDECVRVRRTAWELQGILTILEKPSRGGDELSRFDTVVASIRDAIAAIPMRDADTILPPSSPFMTYLVLRAHCAGARQRVDLFDPFLDAAPFHRFLAVVERAVPITLVTSERVMLPDPGNPAAVRRRDRIVAVSELLAMERPKSYRFLVSGPIHDRHVRLDNEILHLGGSVKDAGRSDPYAIGKLDPTIANNATLDDLINQANEWFGPFATTHRRS